MRSRVSKEAFPIDVVGGDGGTEGIENPEARGLLGGFNPRVIPAPTLKFCGRASGDDRNGEGFEPELPVGLGGSDVVGKDGLRDCLTSFADGNSTGWLLSSRL